MKEKIKLAYYIQQVKLIMKKLDGTIHSKQHVEKMISNEPEIVKDIINELLKEKNYFNENN